MFNLLRKFLKLEPASGILLMTATIFAFLVANSPLATFYEKILQLPLSLRYGDLKLDKPLLFWINDGLMVIFFFLIGLEIKREFLEGYLLHPSQRVLPITATLGGVIFPAVIYLLFNFRNEITIKGWAIPTATDTAFALSILALVGKGIPRVLRTFLMMIAVLDDLIAVLIIALFYAKISIFSLLMASNILMILVLMNFFKVKQISIYIIVSLLLWVFVLQSGVHAAIAGVLAAFTIPLGNHQDNTKRPLIMIEQFLYPWVSYAILPIFAFANAGISFTGLSILHLLEPIPLGIMLGLFFGKQFGIFIGVWIPVKLQGKKLPAQVTWLQIYGISVLCGIGFTMSLFIGMLAFEEEGHFYDYLVRLGILIASFFSAIVGYLILKWSIRGIKFEEN